VGEQLRKYWGGCSKRPAKPIAVAGAWLFCSTLCIAAFAQDRPGDDQLAAEATDPTASLMSFQLNDWYTASLHDAGGTINQIVFRSAIPFDAFGHPNIFRITLPTFTNTPSGRTGVGDTTVFNLTVFNESWGRWGAGVAGSLPTAREGLGFDKWTAGPAFGFVNSSSKQVNWGAFVQTFFSFAGDKDAANVGIINLQPIFSYQLGDGRSLSLGNSAFVYDTHNSRWASLNLGLNYGQVVSFAGHKWRPNIEADYDLKNDYGNPKWTIRASIVLLLPTH